jgi:hypothetical protein
MIELLEKNHDRTTFDCGHAVLNNYIKTQASQDIRRKLSVCYIKRDLESHRVIGYYTLSGSGVPLHFFPEEVRNRLPKSYSLIPAILLGRLAVDKLYHGTGLGKTLLLDALVKSYNISKRLGSFAVVVEPIDEAAESFYSKFGFILLPDNRKMILATETIGRLYHI